MMRFIYKTCVVVRATVMKFFPHSGYLRRWLEYIRLCGMGGGWALMLIYK